MRGFGRRVRRDPRSRPGEHLAQVGRAAVDVAADVVRVLGLEVGRTARRPREHDVAEPGREPLDLALDRRRHVDRRAVGHVAVRPQRVPARRRAAGVDQALLGDEHEGPLGMAAARRRPPPRRRSRRALPPRCTVPARRQASRRPRHRLGERVVELEDARRRSGSGAGHAAVAGGQRRHRRSRRAGAGVTSKQHGPGLREIGQRPHLGAGADLAAERAQVRRHRVGDAPASRRARPASRRRGRARAARARSRAVGARSSGRIECAPIPASRARASSDRKRARGEAGRSAQPRTGEPGREQRVAGQAGRAEHDRGELVPAVRERAHQAA